MTALSRRDTRRSTLWTVARVLLVASVVALGVAAYFGLRPVTNPQVQQCGSPAVFAIRNTDDVRIPPPGSPEEPADAAQLRAQPRCRELVDEQLGHLAVALGIGVVLGLLGAAVGIADDRRTYHRAPRFEEYLVERPSGVPADPWDQPVVPIDDLGERLPEIEWREVRVVVGMGLLALVLLPLLTPWGAVRDALDRFSPGWVGVALVLVALSYPVAAFGVLAASGRAEPGDDVDDSDLVATIEVGLAASFTGRLLPEYGASGLTVHQLVRAGLARRSAIRRISALEALALATHVTLLVLLGLVALVIGLAAGAPLEHQWIVWLFVLAMLAVGAATGPRRYRNLVIRPDRDSPAEVRALSDRPARLAATIASCVGLTLIDAFVVVAAVQAFGASPSVVPVVVASLVAAAAAVVAVTPDGSGVVESMLVVALVWAGVDAGPAVAAALLARIVGFWLPMLPGALALRRLQRDGVL